MTPIGWMFFFEADGDIPAESCPCHTFDTQEEAQQWFESDDCLWAGHFEPVFSASQIALVAAAERERCAKVCDESEIPFDISVWINSTKRQMTGNVAHALADMIRALKDGEEC